MDFLLLSIASAQPTLPFSSGSSETTMTLACSLSLFSQIWANLEHQLELDFILAN